MVGLSGLAVAKITASFMVLGHDGHKNNLGLGLKFEAKGLKVIDYSQKNTHVWEFSEKAVDLLHEYKQRFPEVIAAASRRGDGQYCRLYDVGRLRSNVGRSNAFCCRDLPRKPRGQTQGG